MPPPRLWMVQMPPCPADLLTGALSFPPLISLPAHSRVVFRRPYMDHHTEKLARHTVLDGWKHWRRIINPAGGAQEAEEDSGVKGAGSDTRSVEWEQVVEGTIKMYALSHLQTPIHRC